MKPYFPTDYISILERLSSVNPVAYCSNRNYIDGDVTFLSPYISRGVISTKDVLENFRNRGLSPTENEKFLQELAWRDYWQRVWQEKNIDEDLKNEQQNVEHGDMIRTVNSANAGISAIDTAIHQLYETGYMHNHLRMYVASICTNMARAQWKAPAQWMYYHLLDADWASNALSWQWVSGANSNKKYFANQENINRFCNSNDKHTFLDKSYDELARMEVPNVLKTTEKIELKTVLPEKKEVVIIPEKAIVLYTWHNMDPKWRNGDDFNRILILEPSHFEKYPISEKSLQFLIDLGQNISNLQIFIGEFSELQEKYPKQSYIFKEHPTNLHFQGTEDERDWMSNVTGYFPSFFSFWKKVKKEIIQ
jgi:deoxyribodipyrimidine photo-lyase